MSDVLISAYHGGLGDYLQFSTLPEEFYKQQGRKTYVWDRSYFRNKEIYDLVLAKNPYVFGIKSGEWNAGDIAGLEYKNLTGNCISNWEKLHGLEPRNKYPKIYYEPEKGNNLSDVILVDLSVISLDYNNQKVINEYEKIRKDYPNKTFVKVCFKNEINSYKAVNISHDGKHVTHDVQVDGYLEIENIFMYCDAIASSFGIISLLSGQSHLSCAIKQYHPDLKIFCIVDKEQYDYHKGKDLFIHDNVEYITYD